MSYNLVGKKFGRLTVIEKAGHNKFKQVIWKCVCECKSVINVSTNLLSRGGTQSCGCLALEIKTKHGLSKQQVYQIWHNMISRCTYSNEHYSNRGIKVDSQWEDFENFYHDFGYSYPGKGYSIDRIDVNGNYSLNNVRWATTREQSLNKRNTKLNLDQIVEIRRLRLEENYSYAELGRLFNIDSTHARRIVLKQRCNY